MVPLPVTVPVVAPAVPLRVTSPVAKSVTTSLKTTAKLMVEELVGSACPPAWSMVTVGPVVSVLLVIEGPLKVAVKFPVASWIRGSDPGSV